MCFESRQRQHTLGLDYLRYHSFLVSTHGVARSFLLYLMYFVQVSQSSRLHTALVWKVGLADKIRVFGGASLSVGVAGFLAHLHLRTGNLDEEDLPAYSRLAYATRS